MIEADEAGVPLLVLTADRPPELRGTGANQAIDQLKLYGAAVRWFCEAGVPEARPGMVGYWRSLACRAWAHGVRRGGRLPRARCTSTSRSGTRWCPTPTGPAPTGRSRSTAGRAGPRGPAVGAGPQRPPGQAADGGEPLRLEWAERGAVVCGDGDYDPAPLLELAEAAGWPVLAEPSSERPARPERAVGLRLPARARRGSWRSTGPRSSSRPAGPGCPGASWRSCAEARGGRRPGTWCSRRGPAAGPTRPGPPPDVAAALRLSGPPPGPGASPAWLGSWQRADAAARGAADAILDAERGAQPSRGWPATWRPRCRTARCCGPRPACPSATWTCTWRRGPGSGCWPAAAPAASTAWSPRRIGAALAHQAAGGGPAVALLGDLAFLHDLPGLLLGPDEPRPDLCLVVVNNDGGGIFSTLEQAAFAGPFERVFGTPHGADIAAWPGRPAAVRPADRPRGPGPGAGRAAGCGSSRCRRSARPARRCGPSSAPPAPRPRRAERGRAGRPSPPARPASAGT